MCRDRINNIAPGPDEKEYVGSANFSILIKDDSIELVYENGKSYPLKKPDGTGLWCLDMEEDFCSINRTNRQGLLLGNLQGN